MRIWAVDNFCSVWCDILPVAVVQFLVPNDEFSGYHLLVIADHMMWYLMHRWYRQTMNLFVLSCARHNANLLTLLIFQEALNFCLLGWFSDSWDFVYHNAFIFSSSYQTFTRWMHSQLVSFCCTIIITCLVSVVELLFCTIKAVSFFRDLLLLQ
jgi:hypothetical protein